jgi:hypothetical protein
MLSFVVHPLARIHRRRAPRTLMRHQVDARLVRPIVDRRPMGTQH